MKLAELRTIVGSRDFVYPGTDPEADARRILETLDDSEPVESLEEASRILGGFGVEFVGGNSGAELAYVNAGDTYAGTLAWDGARFVVTSWGDWYESDAQAHEEETGEASCCYCGEVAELEEHSAPSWHGWACVDCRTNH